MAAAFVLACAVACQEKPEDIIPVDPDKNEQPEKPDKPEEEAISNIQNEYADKKISDLGATVSIKFDAAVAWTAEVKLLIAEDSKWAMVNTNTVSGNAKKNSVVRVVVKKNETPQERKLELWLTAEGHEPMKAATLTQASSGAGIDADLNMELNTFMHEILKEDYLWSEEYGKLDVDLTVPYGEFLNTHLLAMGDVNEADGGRYRDSQEYAGERYIYSFISEVQAATKASYTAGLGFGPFISSRLSADSDDMAIAPSYVRQGSPASAVGLRRGDMIFAVNGTRLTTANYRNYMNRLYQNPSGDYVFTFYRYVENGQGGYELQAFETNPATADVHMFDPVLYAATIEEGEHKIGYLVYETFEVTAQDFLETSINEFVEKGITDLILDLRFNTGGAVSQSRWLSGCIAGTENYDKTFVNVVFNDGKTENWKFDYGYSNDTDQLGLPKDLGLERLFVICSYNTASAAELVINSLRGIDFPVKLIGCKTEGKNVGMNMTETTYRGRRFQFAPITFWVRNAKDFGDYPDGFLPDEYVNNDNTMLEDDADNVFPYSFSDWGNMDFNIALQWAYCDITGKPRWSKEPETKGSSSMMPVPVDFQPMDVPLERAGNLIFNR